MLDDIIKQINNRYGEYTIFKMEDGDKRMVEVETISSGSLSLDIALGIGGLPKGRIVEIFGPESGGKTTLALHAAAEAQKIGGRVCFVDVEHALDIRYAKNIGVNIKLLYVTQPNSAEEALEITRIVTESGDFSMVILDSVAALVPQIELEGEMGDQQIGLQARLMSKALRKLTGVASKSNTIIIFINQIREKVGIMWGNPETTPGGRALKFYASIRLDIRKRKQIKDKNNNIIAIECETKVSKNKLAAPFKTANLRINFGKGISVENEIIQLGVGSGLIKRAGGNYKLPQKLTTENFRGLENLCQWLEKNKKKANILKKAIMKRMEKNESTYL